MKDLQFTGTFNGVEVDITFRTDLINSSSENFTVSQIQVGSQFEVTDESDVNHVEIFNDLKKLPTTLPTFKHFAQTRGLALVMKDSTGANPVVLVEEDESESASASSSSSASESASASLSSSAE